MSAITASADGAYLFLALEDGDGLPIILRAARSDLATWSVVYPPGPGAGSAVNVASVPSDPDRVLFYGNFGTDAVVIRHAIAAETNTDLSPASLGSAIVNTLAVDPSDANRIVITVNTARDLKYTEDGGVTWINWDDALGLDATALALLWSGEYGLHRLFVCGQVTGAAVIYYSPNQAAAYGDFSGDLVATDIAALAVTEEATP